MLFNFTLSPLEQIEPWDSPEGGLTHNPLHAPEHGPQRPRLDWFGLTLGQYWLQAGDTTLLEYSPQARSRPGASRYCDYMVARLYEDVMMIAADVLEPIPALLVRCISGESGRRWCDDVLSPWDDECEDDHSWNIRGAANEWRRKRLLDTFYLSPPTGLMHLWSDDALVHIDWDNREKLIDGAPAWTALCGSWQLPREDFIHELWSFHHRLMQQMGERVEAIVAGALRTLRPDIHIDLEVLQKDHKRRSLTMHNMLVEQEFLTPTDWPSAHEAVLTMERRSCKSAPSPEKSK